VAGSLSELSSVPRVFRERSARSRDSGGDDLISTYPRSTLARPGRDPRIDVLRGMALFMIFIDHIPYNAISHLTIGNFALCDAAEVFVLLAGFSAALAYGKAIDRDGWTSGIRRLAKRCWQIYVAQIGLFLATLVIGQLWNWRFNLAPTIFAPVVQAPVKGVLLSFLLAVQPDYLNILPLYIALLAAFPIVWLAMRRGVMAALLLSAAVWLLSAWVPALNLPNVTTHEGWYFDPFAWQFLLTIGVVMARLATQNGGNLPWHPVLIAAAAAFVLLTLPQSLAWRDLGLPLPWSFAVDASDKTHLAWARVLSVVALSYPIFASERVRKLAGSAAFAALQRCGRHSLEVFIVSCLVALFGRLLFRVTDHGLALQLLVNAAGIAAMIGVASWMEGEKGHQQGLGRGVTAMGK
jgi:hypothetical protein